MRYRLSAAATMLLVSALISPHCNAYIVSPSAVPLRQQLGYLRLLTTDLIAAQPGELSSRQIQESHDLMKAWSRLKHDKDVCNSALQVEHVLKRILDEQKAGNSYAKLTTQDYNCVLEAWARCKGEASALRTEQILQVMEQMRSPPPNLDSFKAALMAWFELRFSLPHAAVRAQRILEWMIRSTGDIVPDQDCFDIVLQIWSHNAGLDAPQRAEQLLGVMESLHRETGTSCAPRVTSFNAVLTAWFKNSQRPEAPRRVNEILSFMEQLARDDADVAPDATSYRLVMNTYVQHGESAVEMAEKASALLNHVLEIAEQKEDFDLVDVILFNSAIGLWTKTKQSKSYREAKAILDRQLTFSQDVPHLQPDVFGMTAVIGCCASEKNSGEREKAFQVAVGTYRMFQKIGVKPNHVTYASMLKACSRNLPENEYRDKWVRRVMHDAIESGNVHGMVVQRLQQAANPQLYKELLQGNNSKKLPKEWTANLVCSKGKTKEVKGKRAEM